MHGWTRIGRLMSLGLMVAWLGLLPACKQGEGERCQIDDDCDTSNGFYCELGGNTKTIGGFCKNPSAAAVGDLAKPTLDMAVAPQPDMTAPPKTDM